MTIKERRELERRQILSLDDRRLADELSRAVKGAEGCSGFMGGRGSRFKTAARECKVEFIVNWRIHQWLNSSLFRSTMMALTSGIPTTQTMTTSPF